MLEPQRFAEENAKRPGDVSSKSLRTLALGGHTQAFSKWLCVGWGQEGAAAVVVDDSVIQGVQRWKSGWLHDRVLMALMSVPSGAFINSVSKGGSPRERT